MDFDGDEFYEAMWQAAQNGDEREAISEAVEMHGGDPGEFWVWFAENADCGDF
jgi:hypothetical protein